MLSSVEASPGSKGGPQQRHRLFSLFQLVSAFYPCILTTTGILRLHPAHKNRMFGVTLRMTGIVEGKEEAELGMAIATLSFWFCSLFNTKL